MPDDFRDSLPDDEQEQVPGSLNDVLSALDQYFQTKEQRRLEPVSADRIWSRIVGEIDELQAHEAIQQHRRALSELPSASASDRVWQQVALEIRKPTANPPSPLFARPLMRWAATAAAILLIVLLGTVNTVAAGALPGTPLYPVKRTVEQVRVQLTPPEARGVLQLELAERRQEELEQLVVQGADPDVVVETIGHLLEHLAQVTAADPATNQQEYAQQAAQVVQRREVLAQAVDRWPANYQQPVRNKLAEWEPEQRVGTPDSVEAEPAPASPTTEDAQGVVVPRPTQLDRVSPPASSLGPEDSTPQESTGSVIESTRTPTWTPVFTPSSSESGGGAVSPTSTDMQTPVPLPSVVAEVVETPAMSTPEIDLDATETAIVAGLEAHLTGTSTPTPASAVSGTPTTTLTLTETPTLTRTPTRTPTASISSLFERLYISEFMANPEVVSDLNGEWLELYNSGSEAVNLRGWILADLDNDYHVIDADVWVLPEAYVVLARNGNRDANGGVSVDYVYDNFILGNTQDAIVLLNPDRVRVDRVAWGAGTGLAVRPGASLQRRDFETDATWRTSTRAWPGSAGDYGSPGQDYEPRPTRTPTATSTPTVTATQLPPATFTPTPTHTVPPTPTWTPTAPPTSTWTPSPEPTWTFTPTATPSPTETPSPTDTMVSPLSTPTPTPGEVSPLPTPTG